VLAVAVADGAGSAACGEVGAAVATREALTVLDTSFLSGAMYSETSVRSFLRDALTASREAVLREASLRRVSCRELASTLTIVVAHSLGVAGVQIGDGCVVTETEKGVFSAPLYPQEGEYANETTFLTSDGCLDKAEDFAMECRLGSVSVFTDGLKPVCLDYSSRTPFTGFFKPLINFLRQCPETSRAQGELAALLQSPRICGRSDDDKTLVVLTTDECGPGTQGLLPGAGT
jgi:hypothetical protein